MSTEIKKAAFSFGNLKFPNFSFEESQNPTQGLDVELLPTGIYYQTEGRFELKIVFSAFEPEKKSTPVIRATVVGHFQFKEVSKIEDIPSYFYQNSVAIVFPYLRAFISNLTLQANIKMVILPVMNLQFLEQNLRESTVTWNTPPEK